MCGENCIDTIDRRRFGFPAFGRGGKTDPVGDARTRISRLFSVLVEWRRRAKSRRYLVEMNDFLLRDIGISREQALEEAEKPFWRS